MINVEPCGAFAIRVCFFDGPDLIFREPLSVVTIPVKYDSLFSDSATSSISYSVLTSLAAWLHSSMSDVTTPYAVPLASITYPEPTYNPTWKKLPRPSFLNLSGSLPSFRCLNTAIPGIYAISPIFPFDVVWLRYIVLEP